MPPERTETEIKNCVWSSTDCDKINHQRNI